MLQTGQKGSDVSAREATRKIVAARRQLAAVRAVLAAAGLAPNKAEQAQHAAHAHGAGWTGSEDGDAAAGGQRGPRNTIVRSVLRGLQGQRGA